MKYNKKKLYLIIPIVLFLGLLAIFIKDIVQMLPLIKNADEESVRAALSTLGSKGAIVIGCIVAVQLLIVFMPCEFMEIMSGVAYGPWWGTLICITGVIVGASLIYALINVFNVKLEVLFAKSKSYETISKLSRSTKSISKLLLILFFLPAIPLGVICYFGSTTNLKYHWYILITAIGALPSIIIDSVLGHVFVSAIGKYFWWILIAVMLFAVIAMWLVKLYTTKKMNIALYGTKNPTVDMVLDNHKPASPKAFNIWFLTKVAKHIKRKYNVKVNNDETKKIKDPFIMLSPHGCWADFLLGFLAINPYKTHVMMNAYYLYNKKTQGILLDTGVIPKKMFANDLKSIKDCMAAVKNDESILMMPEARLSIDGSNQPFAKGLGKLIKKLNIPVITLETHGAYLSMAKWVEEKRKGTIEVTTHLTLTPEKIQELSADEIDDICAKALAFNDFEWVKDSPYVFKGKNMLEGAENLVYKCPKCGHEYTLIADKNTITCAHCDLQVSMDGKYQFINPYKNIHNLQDWYRYQKQEAQKVYDSGNFKLETEVTLKTYDDYGKGMVSVGEGKCVLDKEGLRYDGTFKGEEHHLFIPAHAMQALPFGCGEDFETYWDNIFYYFVPKENKAQCVQWGIYSDIMIQNSKKDE